MGNKGKSQGRLGLGDQGREPGRLGLRNKGGRVREAGAWGPRENSFV